MLCGTSFLSFGMRPNLPIDAGAEQLGAAVNCEKRFRPILLTIALTCTSATGSAQSPSGTVWIPLDASKPEHAAVLGWHRALAENDYASYLRYTGGISGLSEQTQRAHFDTVRSMTPPKLMITANPSHVNPNGTKDYTVAGCLRMPGDPDEMRMVAGVTPYQKDGQWRISGSDFGPPWNNTIRACPVR